MRCLRLEERESISRGIAAGISLRQIAIELGRSPSTISREINRNGGPKAYRATVAENRAWGYGKRPKRCKLLLHGRLQQAVARLLRRCWSPEQISHWLERTYPDDTTMHVSHETIYRSLFIQARGVLKKELVACLRSGRMMRHSRHATKTRERRGQIIEAVSIRDRPAAVEDRAIPGHWEGDLISGSSNTHIATLVERQSRYTILAKVAGKDTASVVDALVRQIMKLPASLRKTLTWDRGSELADHKRLSIATDLKVFFCDPRSPWQRGSNENTNGLLRQYLPKGGRISLFIHRRSSIISPENSINVHERLLTSEHRQTYFTKRCLDRLSTPVPLAGIVPSTCDWHCQYKKPSTTSVVEGFFLL